MSFRRYLIFLLLTGAAAAGAAEGDVTVIVVDGPVDHSHPELAPYVDERAMEALRAPGDWGGEISWLQRNALFRQEFDSASPEVVRDQPTHGTRVAGITVSGTEGTRLLNFPVVRPAAYGRYSWTDLLRPDWDAERARQRKQWETLGRGITQSGARVVNLSIAHDEGYFTDYLRRCAGPLQSVLLYGHFWHLARRKIAIDQEEFERLVLAHPETVFVLAAGNSRAEIESLSASYVKASAPNLVKVANVDADLRLAADSNWSFKMIDVAAIGENLVAPVPGEGRAPSSGTSLSAPFVSRRFADIFRRDPRLSARAAITKFHAEETVRVPRLSNLVREGRVLRGMDPLLPLFGYPRIYRIITDENFSPEALGRHFAAIQPKPAAPYLLKAEFSDRLIAFRHDGTQLAVEYAFDIHHGHHLRLSSLPPAACRKVLGALRHAR